MAGTCSLAEDVMAVAKESTRTDSIKRSGTKDDGFAKEISRLVLTTVDLEWGLGFVVMTSR